MYWQKEQSVGDVLQKLIEDWGLKDRMERARIIEAWAILAGPHINAVTEDVRVYDRKLYVHLTSAPWRNELHLRRMEWCKRLNEELGEAKIQEIIFR